MLLLTMFCYLFFYTGRHNFGWAAKQLAVALNISFEKIGWVSFSMLIGYAAGQLVHGNWADRFSPKHMITIGGLLSVTANVLISFSSSFTAILILWTLNGYFQSMAWAAGSRIISNWWRDKRGLAFGMYTMAAGTSSILTYLFSILLVNEGWRNLFRIPVLFLAVAVIIFFIFVRNGPAYAEGSEEKIIEQEKLDWKHSYATVFRNKKFLVVCLSIGFQSMARYGLIFWIPLYFLSKETDAATSRVWVSLLLPVGMAIGAFSFGYISDKFFNSDRIKSIALGMTCCAIVSVLLFVFQLQSTFVIGVFVFLAGFCSYGPQANFWPLAPELLGQRYVGTGTGVMNMCAYLFAALGEPLMGKLIDVTNNKAIIFLIVALIALLSAGTILLTKMFKSNNNPHSVHLNQAVV